MSIFGNTNKSGHIYVDTQKVTKVFIDTNKVYDDTPLGPPVTLYDGYQPGLDLEDMWNNLSSTQIILTDPFSTYRMIEITAILSFLYNDQEVWSEDGVACQNYGINSGPNMVAGFVNSNGEVNVQPQGGLWLQEPRILMIRGYP